MTDERIIAYLLGELPDEESERFEDECFAGEDWPEEVALAEEDLIDAYLRDELARGQRASFERNYLRTEARVQRVAAAAALLRHVDESALVATDATDAHATPTQVRDNFLFGFRGNRSWGMRAAVVFGVAVVAVGAWWLARTRTQSPRTIATVTLNVVSNNTRAEGARVERVRLAPDADALRVTLRLPERAAADTRFRLEFENDESEKSTLPVAAQDAESVSTEIPAARLTRGQYSLRLFAATPGGAERNVGSYLFIVE